jgi:predicted nucleic acid-binding protein
MALLLDTCILIDLLRGNQVAEAAVSAFDQRPKVCAVSALELLAGARSQSDEAKVENVLAAFGSVSIDDVMFRRAGRFLHHYRKSHRLDVPDALIAAVAEQHGLKLVTLNLKHFPMFKKLKRPY